jgi:hypothetical protein
MTWIFYAKCDDDKLTSTYVAWYKISVQLVIIIIMEILTPTIVFDQHVANQPLLQIEVAQYVTKMSMAITIPLALSISSQI